jgi:hypothetical protein
VSSRGNDGMITFREWHPVGVEEYGYAVPDPLNENIVYGGKVTRYDRRIAQVQNIAPTPVRPADFRTLRTAPVVFSAADPHVMYFAANTLWKTADGGKSWTKISPDLTRRTFEIPTTIGKYRDQDSARATQRGVIYAVAPSPLDINRIWAGTDDGLIQTTTDGGATWTDVTPPGLKPFAKVSVMDAGHFDANTAYAAINTLRLDDMRPHIFRTHDGGKTWTEIVNGLPNGAPVDSVREDPKKKGLLFAGTEHEVHVSFDDGDHWQSLRINMPATSVRDVIVHGDDLIAGTHGRGIWILDDITPLRQTGSATLSGSRDAFLFAPQTAYRVRQNTNTDTPIPPDETAGQNPPDGAIINYSLASDASGPVTLEIFDAAGRSVRKYSSDDRIEMPTPANAPVPLYWYRAPHPLATSAGMHRFMWDIHYQPIPGGGGGRGGLPIAAVPHDTVPAPASPWAAPGQYTVKLTVNGKGFTQPLVVKIDPRVKTTPLGLSQQFTLSKQMYDDVLKVQAALADVRALRAKVGGTGASLSGEPARSAESLALRLAALEGGGGRGGGGRGGAPEGADTLGNINGGLNQLMGLMQGADVTPTTQLVAAVGARHAALAKLMAQWTALKAEAARLKLN